MRLKPNTLIVVAGPTASGKTALAIQIAKAVDGEIVSADSMQIYRGVDIATAKPTPEELAAVPHHLIGFLPMDRAFSVADYAELARKEINDILSRGKVPVLCGGTGLYIKEIFGSIADKARQSPAMKRCGSGCGSWRSGRAMMPCGGGWKQWTPKRPSVSTLIMWAGSFGPLR